MGPLSANSVSKRPHELWKVGHCRWNELFPISFLYQRFTRGLNYSDKAKGSKSFSSLKNKQFLIRLQIYGSMVLLFWDTSFYECFLPRRGLLLEPRATPWGRRYAPSQALKGRIISSMNPPFQGLKQFVLLLPGRCPGLYYVALSGQTTHC